MYSSVVFYSSNSLQSCQRVRIFKMFCGYIKLYRLQDFFPSKNVLFYKLIKQENLSKIYFRPVFLFKYHISITPYHLKEYLHLGLKKLICIRLKIKCQWSIAFWSRPLVFIPRAVYPLKGYWTQSMLWSTPNTRTFPDSVWKSWPVAFRPGCASLSSASPGFVLVWRLVFWSWVHRPSVPGQKGFQK